jgi:hypothetical protein
MKLIPHFSALAPGVSALLKSGVQKENRNFLPDLYISLWDFDEKWYLSKYPDLATAIPSETFPTAWDHFMTIGYFEGRLPVEPRVDEAWYLKRYPDVAAAIFEGIFEDARQHFERNGYREGRLAADPGVSPEWYAARYLRARSAVDSDAEACTDHFIQLGYRNCAIPSPPA